MKCKNKHFKNISFKCFELNVIAHSIINKVMITCKYINKFKTGSNFIKWNELGDSCIAYNLF